MFSLKQKISHQYFRNNDQSAIKNTSHLAIGAHPDDLEIMAGHGILECFQNADSEFFGVVVTSGSGSASGTQDDIEKKILERRNEQVNAAIKGDYLGVVQLAYESSDIKTQINMDVIDELKNIIEACQPKVIYCHNPFDKHLTHVRVLLHVLEALKTLSYIPQQFFGCEVWRGLDWLVESDKASLAIENPGIIEALIAEFKSQIDEAKDYPSATLGRFKANAVFRDANQIDDTRTTLYAIDLLPLIKNKNLGLKGFAKQYLERFQQEVLKNLG